MTDDRIRIDPELTRRRFLQGSALAGAAAFLAACGTPGTGSSAPSSAASAAASAPPRPRSASASAAAATPATSGELRWANWIGYIDTTDDGTYPTIKKFEDESGIKVTYAEDVDDNETFFTSDLQAPLDAGLPTEWDHRRRHRLDGRPTGPAGLARDHRHEPDAELRRQPRRELQGPLLRSRHQPGRPVAVGHDRDRLRQEQDRRPRLRSMCSSPTSSRAS